MWQNYIKVVDIFTMLGVIVAIFQLYNGNRIKRGEFIRSVYDKFISDSHIKNVIYKMDYGETWYTSCFHGSLFEKDVDSLFRYLSYICYLRQKKLISKKDMKLFEYVLNRTCLSSQSIEYLWNIYHFSQSNHLECSFMPLIEYGTLKGNITPDFYNKDSVFHHKFLNF